MHPKEVLLEHVINDCRKKGARIQGWGRSPNGRIILHESSKLPQFFFNHFVAIDFLIHSYKLKNRYKYIYETSGKPRQQVEPDAQNAIKDPRTFKQRLIQNMQKLLESETRIFGQNDELLILNAIHTTCGKNTDRNVFNEVKDILIDYFTDLMSQAVDTYRVHYLRRVLTFLQKLTYRYFSEAI